MDFKTYAIKNVFMPFFIIVTCVCAAMAVIGMLYEPGARFGYEILTSPLIVGAATTLPSLVNYSKRELSIREALIRKLLHLALIEAIVLLLIYLTGTLRSVSLNLSVSLTVLLIFAVVHLVCFIGDQKTARECNKALQKMQEGTLRNG